ncbi:hypothetical protein HFO17_35585 [Rhizobium laguerreae]|nr:hypothetical protein [Rhizobium laguerreae]
MSSPPAWRPAGRQPAASKPGCSAEHDAEKCDRFSDDIMLQLYNLEQDSDFRPTRPKIILF